MPSLNDLNREWVVFVEDQTVNVSTVSWREQTTFWWNVMIIIMSTLYQWSQWILFEQFQNMRTAIHGYTFRSIPTHILTLSQTYTKNVYESSFFNYIDTTWLVSLGVFLWTVPNRFRTFHVPRSMKWFRTFWATNMVDKLTLLFLSAELEMNDDDDEMNLEESVVIAYCSHSCCFHVI